MTASANVLDLFNISQVNDHMADQLSAILENKFGRILTDMRKKQSQRAKLKTILRDLS